MIDPLYVASGFGVGLLVGMTGVGGGSLMTPLLILLFGVHPTTAVGTDLLYAAATKTGGSLVHGLGRSIHWPAVIRLAGGSLPASAATMLAMWQLNLDASAQRTVVNLVLCFALLLTATSLIFRKAIMERYRRRLEHVDEKTTAVLTVVTGAALGVRLGRDLARRHRAVRHAGADDRVGPDERDVHGGRPRQRRAEHRGGLQGRLAAAPRRGEGRADLAGPEHHAQPDAR